MSCPGCQQTLQLITFDNQAILHCSNCGGSFFEENGINRISIFSARKLLLIQNLQNRQIPPAPQLCPKDGDALYLVTNDEAVPQDVTLFRCGHCRGIFSYPDGLIRFKQAQGAKLNYFKFWNVAPSTIRAVAVLTFVGVISLSIFSNYLFLQKNTLTTSKADEVIKNISISKYDRYLFISFKTQIPLKSRIIFNDKKNNLLFEKNVSLEPKSLHTLTTTDLSLDQLIYYQIVGVDSKGMEIRTREAKLIIRDQK